MSACTSRSKGKLPGRLGSALQQQDRFDSFRPESNEDRPHEALDMKRPADLSTASTRRYDGLPELTYPFHRDIASSPCCLMVG